MAGLLLFFLAHGAEAVGGAAPELRQARPNIIFLLADDHRCDALGCMGNREIETPNLDRLAADGMLFLRHYNSSPICMASRATLMTGLYEYRHGCNFDRGSMGLRMFRNSYPVLLRQSGYRVGFAGKFGFAVTPQPTASSRESETHQPIAEFDWWAGWVGQGFYETARNPHLRKYAQRYPHVSRALGAAACDFIRESAAMGKPFCLSVSFKAPHHPYTPDPQDEQAYQGRTLARPANWGREQGALLPEQARRSRMYLEEFVEWSTDDQFQRSQRLYYQLVNGNDAAVGMIRQAVNELGLADETVIVYTSDNGWMCGDHGLGGKVFPYEGSARAPLILLHPGRPESAGRRTDALTGGVDLPATLLDLAGASTAADLDGVSLLPLLRRPDVTVRDSLPLMNAWPWSAEQLTLAVVTDQWKYIFWFYGDTGLEPAEELYNLRDDPLEMYNLARRAGRADDLRRMRNLYDRLRADALSTCAPLNDYPAFLKAADRSIPWAKKRWPAPPLDRATTRPRPARAR